MKRNLIWVFAILLILPTCKLSKRKASVLTAGYGNNSSSSSSKWRSGGNRIASSRTSKTDVRTKKTPNYKQSGNNYSSSRYRADRYRQTGASSTSSSKTKPTSSNKPGLGAPSRKAEANKRSIADRKKTLRSSTATPAEKRSARQSIKDNKKNLKSNQAKEKFEKQFGKKYDKNAVSNQRAKNTQTESAARQKIKSSDPKVRAAGRKELRQSKRDQRSLNRVSNSINKNSPNATKRTSKKQHKRTSDAHQNVRDRNRSAPENVSYSRNNGYHTPYGGYYHGGYGMMMYPSMYGGMGFLETYIMFSMWSNILTPRHSSGHSSGGTTVNNYGSSNDDGSFQNGYEAGIAAAQKNVDIQDPRAQEVYNDPKYAAIEDRFQANENPGEAIDVAADDLFKVPADMSLGNCSGKFGATLLVKEVFQETADVIYFTPNESGTSDAMECTDEAHVAVALSKLWDMNRQFRGRQVVEYGEGAAAIDKEFDGEPFNEIPIDETVDVTICGASAPEGLYNEVASRLVKSFNTTAAGKAKARFIKTGGSRDNIDLIESQECQVGIVQADAISLARKEPGRSTLPVSTHFLFNEYAHLICRHDSGIKSLRDLAEKIDSQTIMIGMEGSGAAVTWINAINQMDNTFFNIATIGGEEASDKLIAGQAGVDCMFSIIGMNSGLMKSLANIHGETMGVVSFWDSSFKNDKNYIKADLGKDNYEGKFLADDVEALAVKAMFVKHNNWALENPTLDAYLKAAIKENKADIEALTLLKSTSWLQ